MVKESTTIQLCNYPEQRIMNFNLIFIDYFINVSEVNFSEFSELLCRSTYNTSICILTEKVGHWSLTEKVGHWSLS